MLQREPVERRAYIPNPFAGEALTRTANWAAAKGIPDVLDPAPRGIAAEAAWHEQSLTDRLSNISAGLAAHVGPELSAEGLELTSYQCAWLFYFDSFADGEARDSNERPQSFYEMFSIADEILADPARFIHSENPFAATLADLSLAFKTQMPPWQCAAWHKAIQGYLGGVELELYYRDNNEQPPLEEFIYMRQQTSGVRVVATMLGAAAQLEVPEQNWADLQEIIDLTTDIIAWDNDITSYAGELREGRAELNLITVIQQQLGKSEAEAIDTVVRMCNQKEAFDTTPAAVGARCIPGSPELREGCTPVD